MKWYRQKRLLAFLMSAALAACSSGSNNNNGGGSPPPTTPPPPPATADAVEGIWEGTTATTAAPDVTISFSSAEVAPFERGSAPYTASFETSVLDGAESDGEVYSVAPGAFSDIGFETWAHTLSFTHSITNAGDNAVITLLDIDGNPIDTVIPTDTADTYSIELTLADAKIATLRVDNTGAANTGSVVIDDIVFGYAVPDAAGNIDCVITVDNEFACTLRNEGASAIEGGARGTLSVTTEDEVSGSGEVYAALGNSLPNGPDSGGAPIRGAALTVSSGTIVEGSTLELVLESPAQITTATMTYDDDYDKPSSLATIAGTLTDVEIFGNAGALVISPEGVVDGSFTTQGATPANCTITGQVNIIDAEQNAYDVSMNLSLAGPAPNCGVRSGDYTGLAITRDTDGDDVEDRIVFRVFSEPQPGSDRNRYVLGFGGGTLTPEAM